MGRELQRHFAESDVDVRMMIHFLRLPGDPVDEVDAFKKPANLNVREIVFPRFVQSDTVFKYSRICQR